MSRVAGIVAAEWTKLRTVRSTAIALGAAAVVTLGLCAIVTHQDASGHAALPASFDPVEASLGGLAIAQLAFGVLGVLTVTSEYASGLIATTFAAVPRRRAVLAAKTAVAGGIGLLAGEALAFAAFFLGELLLAPRHLSAALDHGPVLRQVAGSGFFLLTVTIVGVGLGAVIRHTAGAIATLAGLVFVLPPLIYTLPKPWNEDIFKWTLDGLSQGLAGAQPHAYLPGPVAAFLGCLVTMTVLLAAGAILITRRDA
jgi:hypothetical protein